jgi:hypothetical protein
LKSAGGDFDCNIDRGEEEEIADPATIYSKLLLDGGILKHIWSHPSVRASFSML